MSSVSTRWRFVKTSAKNPTERVYYGFYVKMFAVREYFGSLNLGRAIREAPLRIGLKW